MRRRARSSARGIIDASLTRMITDLPGVRQPVQSTGMGRIVPPMDAPALAQAIVVTLGMKKEYDPSLMGQLETHYSPETIAHAYEGIFKDLLERNG